MSFRHTVLQEGMNVFRRHGIRELSMEAILSQLDISRGTLAEIARSKTELLEQCVEQALTERKIQFAQIMSMHTNPPQTIIKLLRLHLETLAGNHPAFFTDLQSYHQPCWDQIEEFSEQILKVYLKQLLAEGLEQEHFQPNLDAKLVSQLLLAQA
ncbi:MAG TPA: TetR/AcrR family transcriptional regulator, partial [Adhaeribacter sp.]|nr:TetR/AcrR family transcriptional regulator [Adhaeribacter sp.]